MSQLGHFLHHTLKLGIPFEMVQLLLKNFGKAGFGVGNFGKVGVGYLPPTPQPWPQLQSNMFMIQVAIRLTFLI